MIVMPPATAPPEPIEPLDQGVATPEELLPSEDEELAALVEPDAEDVEVIEPEPPPLARGWAFDFHSPDGPRFIPHTAPAATSRGRGPQETRGIATLRVWIEKCLNTARGAHPIYSDDYGMDEPFGHISRTAEGLIGLEGKIRDALTYHPRITDVQDFEIADPSVPIDDEGGAWISFTVVLDDETTLTVEL